MARYDSYLTRFLARDPAGIPPFAPAFERLFLGLLCTLGVPTSPRYQPFGNAAVQAAGLSPLLRLTGESGKSGESGPYPVDQIRRALVWIGTPESSGDFLLQQLAGLFRPNPVWPTAVSRLTDDDFARHQTDSYLERLADAGLLRSHDVLGEWAARFTRPFAQRIWLRRDRLRDSAELATVLRGDNPEMRPAIRLALAEAAAGHGGLRGLAGVAQQILPIPVVDLSPNAVPPLASSEARKFLVQLVEYVDRSGVMGEFLAAVGGERPDAELLHRVGKAFMVWEGAHALMLTTLMARLRVQP